MRAAPDAAGLPLRLRGRIARIHHRDAARPAQRHPHAALGIEGDAIRPAGDVPHPPHRQRIGVDFRQPAIHAGCREQRPTIGGREDGVRPAAEGEAARHLPRLGVEDGEVIAPHHADDQLAAMPDDPRRLRPDLGRPELGAGFHVEGHHRAVALHGDEDAAAVGGEGDVARHVARAEAMHQRQRRGVVDIHLVAPEARDHQPAAIGAVFQVIGVRDPLAPPHIARRGVEEDQLIPRRIPQHQLPPIRRQHQVVRFPQHGNAAHFLARGGVQDADRGLARIQHEQQVRARGRGQQQRQDRQGERQVAQAHGTSSGRGGCGD